MSSTITAKYSFSISMIWRGSIVEDNSVKPLMSEKSAVTSVSTMSSTVSSLILFVIAWGKNRSNLVRNTASDFILA